MKIGLKIEDLQTILGLESQKDAVKNYLKNKYPPDFHFKEVESRKSSGRPELHKALELCKIDYLNRMQ